MSGNSPVAIEYDGIIYNSIRSACKAAGISDSKVSSFKRRYPNMTAQEAFDSATVHRRQWTPEERAILIRDFPEKGVNIPELASRYGPNSIRAAATRLGVKRAGDYYVEGARVSYTQGLALLNTTTNIGTILKEKYRLSNQQVLDRLVFLNKRTPEGRYERLARRLTDEESDYIHYAGKWWSLSVFCLHHPEWNAGSIQHFRFSRSLSLQTTFEWLCNIDNHLEDLWITAGKLSGYAFNGITSACNAYLGVDGKQYVFCKCSVCKRILLLPLSRAVFYKHCSDCLTFEIPNCINIGWEARSLFLR